MPTFLPKHYKQYKSDTAQLSTWLVKTALSLGYPIDSLDVSTETVNETVETAETRTAAQIRNAKRKQARRQAKARAKEDNREATESSSPSAVRGLPEGAAHASPVQPRRVTLRVAQYILLATYIVDKNQDIPIEVVRILRRCIRLRKRAADSFASSPHSELAQVSHQHFVDALEQVLVLFSANCSTANSVKASQVDDSPMNRFASLNIDEEGTDDDTNEDLSDITLPGVSYDESLWVTLEMDIEEGCLAVVTFLKEVADVRRHIKDLWRDYKAGKVDIITAAVTTNTSLQLLGDRAHKLMKETSQVFFNDSDMMLFLAVCFLRARAESENSGPLDWPSNMPRFANVRDPVLASAYELALIPVMQLLIDLAIKLQSTDALPTFPSSSHDIDVADTKVSDTDYQEQWRRTRDVLTASFTDIAFILGYGAVGQSRRPVRSVIDPNNPRSFLFGGELLMHFDRFFKWPRWNLLIAVASQIFVDIKVTLGPDAADGSKQLRSTADRMVRTLDIRISTEGPLPPDREHWNPINESGLKNIYALARSLRDFDLKSFTSKCPELHQSGALYIERDPTLCGLLLFKLYNAYQNVGYAFSSIWDSITCTAHLNRACRMTTRVGKRNIPVWQDMDLLIDLHGAEFMFAGPVPSNLDEAQSSFLRMMGYPQNFIDMYDNLGRRGPKRPPPKRFGPSSFRLVFRETGRVLPILARVHVHDDEFMPAYEVKDLEKVLYDIHQEQQQTPPDSEAGASHSRSRDQLARPDRPHRRHENRQPSKLSVTELLSVLRAALVAETRSLRFDYVSLHLRCLRLIKDLHRLAYQRYAEMPGWSCAFDDPHVTSIIAVVIHLGTAYNRGMRRRVKGDTSKGAFLDDGVGLSIASQLLSELLSKEGESDQALRLLDSEHLHSG